MSREGIAWIVVGIAVLVAGSAIGQHALTRSDVAGTALSPEPADRGQGRTASEAFRPSFWGNRALDVAVQVGLIFVAALGIAALLPRRGEDGEE
jgi:hypothetical protein